MVEQLPHGHRPDGHVAADRNKGLSPSVLFSKLKPGARIDPHTGPLNCRLICYLALVVPTGCGLRVGGERRDVVRGEVWAFDESINNKA